ncbi:MAG: NACHT domain-containing protein [Spirochaetales bacterium]|nr:NACHT domain-containing protein [Spirochaetales bacterium]
MCRKSPDREEIAIGEYQLKKALERVKQERDVKLIINLFHHPLEWLWPRDRKLCRTYFHNTVCLVGHLHDSAGYLSIDYETRVSQFQAGGLYLGSESEWPCQYHYLTFDEDANTLRLDFRKFSKDSRRWVLDGDKGNDGIKVYNNFFLEQKATNKSLTQTIEIQVKQDALFEKYLACTHNEHRHLPAKGFDLTLPVLITQIYVKMRAFLHAESPKKGAGPADFSETGSMRTETGIVDMKQAFGILEKHTIKDMVILGDPGAGKTTLLKYITISLIEDRGKEILGLGSRLIPFFAPLRELKDPRHEDFYSFISRVCCFDDRGVNITNFKDLLEKGKAIILLDGLDEVAATGKRLEVIKWIEKARNTHYNVHFIITSRFAGYTGIYRLDGNLLELAVDDFTPEEIHEFLYNWYRTVEGFLHGGDEDAKKKGEADAEILYNEIVGSKRLKSFVKNPLLLQITALVHRDRGHLPERRVELYEECTSILLEKWDMARGLDVTIRAREARKILQPIALWLHKVDERRSAPLQEIMKVLQKPLEELGKSGVDCEALLKNIRDRSGIFTGYSHDEYGFIHLSFQEYLAAEEIRNRDFQTKK